MNEDREFYQIRDAHPADADVVLGHNGDPEILPPGTPIPLNKNVRYRPEYPAQAEKLCRFGATDAELAEFFEVSYMSILRWRTKYPEFDEALTVGKKHADDRVVASLYQRATGYNLRVEKLFAHQGVVTRAETIEHIPASEKAIFMWLINRRPDEWRNKQEITGKDGAPLIPESAADKAELARWAAFLLKRGEVEAEQMLEEG